ncbi:MAG: glycosyltransferase family 4 protein [Acidobacteriaceae bacterium]|nr:glycosyltransferase family 4 protein [Acidobacteriaceae bacterium]
MTTDAVGGVWQYSIDLIAGLMASGAEILLASMGPRPTAAQRQQLAAIARASFVESDYALEWMPNPWRDVDACGEWLLHLESDFKPHIVHLNGYRHAAFAWKAPVLVVAHSCVFSWWRAVHGCAPGDEWTEYKRRVTSGLNAATAVAAPSLFMARALENEYGFPAEHVQVIHNFSKMQPYNGAVKRPVILAAGRLWDQAKNVQLLDNIARRLDWPVYVAGNNNGPHGSTQRGTNVHLLGNLAYPELLDQYERASIFVHPAVYEPFGLSVLEAARSRCCLVLSDIPSLRELWSDAAIFANARDPDSWVSQLNALTREAQLRHEFAGRAFTRSQRFCTESSITEYLKFYRTLAASNTTRPEEAAA